MNWEICKCQIGKRADLSKTEIDIWINGEFKKLQFVYNTTDVQ